MNRELEVEIIEEINPLDISVKQDGKGNAPCLSKILRENLDDITELNVYEKEEDIEGKQKIRQ